VLSALSVRQISVLAALLEILVAVVLIQQRHRKHHPWMLVWLASLFLAYRLGLYLVGYQGSCRCLGNPMSWLPRGGWWLDPLLSGLVVVMLASGLYCWREEVEKPGGDP
jgi:membrane protein implicated in regulation of membrane protease activity